MMFKFNVKKNLKINGESSKSSEEFFNFSKIETYGFPHKPSALAWEPFLSIMAIGTQKGIIRIYGAPGVCITAQHKEPLNILNLIFIPKKGRLISHCDDNSLHLWELNTLNGSCGLTEIKSYILVGLMKKITSLYLKLSCDILFLGTMCGNIYTLNVDSFEMADSVTYRDVVLQNISEDINLSQGCVKVICEQPGNSDCVFIGYQNGLMVIWDLKALVVVCSFVPSQGLESISWHRKGKRFMSSHSDGSYMKWSIETPSKPVEVPYTPYGPFACKAIEKILWKSMKGGEDYVMFSGGMQRAVHGDKNSITLMTGTRQNVYDFSSKVVDFFAICDASPETGFDNPHSLVILLEEELIALDLESENWLPLRLPYLNIPHSSPIICSYLSQQVLPDVAKTIQDMGQMFDKKLYSEREWPIKGGTCQHDPLDVQNLLITGHENGSLRFWNVSGATLQLIHTFSTAKMFLVSDKCDDSDEDDWPTFTKIGNFESLTDDSRLAIRKIIFNDITKTLIVGGTGGQILIFSLVVQEDEKDIRPSFVHFAGDYYPTMFVGQSPLMLRPGFKPAVKGLHLSSFIQLSPPVAITALAFHTEWNVLAAGTPLGFFLFDVIQKKSIMSKCTMVVSEDCDSPSQSDEFLNKSLRRSLRDSFRKLRKGKSFRDRTGSLCSDTLEDNIPASVSNRESFTSSPDPTFASSPSPELRSFTSDSEPRNIETALTSTVRCVYLAQSFIINNMITTPTFWAGTSNGSIYVYTLTLPILGARALDQVTCHLGKEMQLRHRAAVLSIQIVDHSGYPLPDPLDVRQDRQKPADLSRSHKVVICSEEQIKVFTLPSLKSHCKYKVNLLEQCLLSQVTFSTFQSKTDTKSKEHSVVCLTNTNEIAFYMLPDLKKRTSYQCAAANDVCLSSSFIIIKDHYFMYMSSPSEFDLCSLSSVYVHQPFCAITHIEGSRDAPEPTNNIILEVCNISNITDEEDEDRLNSTANVENPTSNLNAASNVENCAVVLNGNINSEQRVNTDGQSNVESRGNVNSSHVISRFGRAPLARIDELNISDEQHANHSHNESRIVFHKS